MEERKLLDTYLPVSHTGLHVMDGSRRRNSKDSHGFRACLTRMKSGRCNTILLVIIALLLWFFIHVMGPIEPSGIYAFSNSQVEESARQSWENVGTANSPVEDSVVENDDGVSDKRDDIYDGFMEDSNDILSDGDKDSSSSTTERAKIAADLNQTSQNTGSDQGFHCVYAKGENSNEPSIVQTCSTFSDHTTKPWKEKNDLSRGTTKTSLDDYNMVTAEDDSIKDDENQIDNDINADTDNFGVYDIEEESEDNVTESHINSEKDQNEFDTYNLEEEINDTNAANDVHDDGNAKIDVDNAKEESYDAIVQDNKESQGNNLVEENNQPLLQDQKAILEVEINQTAKRIEEIEEKPDKMNTSVDNVADDFVNSSKINDTNYSNDESIGFDIAENRQVVDEKPDTSVVQLNDKDGESDSLLAQPIILEHGVDGENGNKLEERETNSELDQTDYIRNDDGSNHLLLRRLRSTDPPNITFDKDIKQHTVHSRDSQTNTEIHDKHKDNHEADPIIVYNVKEQHNHKSTTNPNNFQENINQVSLKNSYTLKSEKDAQVKYDQGILKTINPLLKTIKESIKTSHNQLGHLNDDQTHENDNSQGKFVQEIIQDNHQEQALQANMIARENAHERVIQQILKSGKSGKENYKHENVQMIGNVHEQVNQENLETRDNNQERNIQARIEEEEDTIQEQVFHKHLETRSGAHNQNISENLGTKDSAKKQVIQELTETEDVAQEQVIHTNVETGDIQENLEIRNNSEEQNTQGSIETGDRVLEQVFQENVETGDSAQEQVIQGNMKVSNQVQKVHTGGNVAKSKHAQNSSHTKANDDSSENVRSTQMHEKTENPNEISYNTSHIKTNNNLIEKHKKVTLKNNSIYKAGIKIGNEKDDSQTVTVKYLETDKSKTHRDNVRQKRSIVHI